MADIKINGATPSAFYFGSTAATAVYYGSTKLWPVTPPTPVLPAKTIRCKFTSGFTPSMGDTQTLVDADENIWDIYKSSNDWVSLFENSATIYNDYLERVIGANTTGVTRMMRMFYGCRNLTSVLLFDTSSVSNTNSMFGECRNLTSVPRFDTSSVTNMASMFYNCDNLTTVPLFDTSSVTIMEYMLAYCDNLTTVPLFDTSSVTNMEYMLKNCYKVQSGALALYNQASTQAVPPTRYSGCFNNCGRDTVTGAAELAQIPASWGGTGA